MIMLASKSIYNFTSNIMLTYFTLQIYRVAEMTSFHCYVVNVY